MKEKIRNILIITTLIVLEILYLVFWALLAVFVCKYLILVGIIISFIGYMLVRGSYKYENEESLDEG